MYTRPHRGPFQAGERVQLTDPKGRHYTISLAADGQFQSNRGSFPHAWLIGKEEGSVVISREGRPFLALRPLISDYVLSMPRGATVIYPKDAAQITHGADVFPGARVFEAGAGSGALSISLLDAIGEAGELLSVERRPEFAEIAAANVISWFGTRPSCYEIRVGEAGEALLAGERAHFDHVILDMLAPWEMIPSAVHALRPGGVFLAYVATTTQLSRTVETLRGSGRFTEPEASETLVRTWHSEGLAVRPDHRMVAHTGFLVQARRLADGAEMTLVSRPSKGAYAGPMPWETQTWDEDAFGERAIAPRKLRRVRRDIAERADIEETGSTSSHVHLNACSSGLTRNWPRGTCSVRRATRVRPSSSEKRRRAGTGVTPGVR